MPAKVTIPIGTRFGRLTVQGPSPERRSTFACWGCRCDCGMIVIVAGINLRAGKTLSCGCLLADVNRQLRATHGMTDKVPEYQTWLGMRGRCLRRSNPQWKNYGGRGITICAEWSSFWTFYRDMGAKPSPKHTIDRIDNDGPYSPENCRWASPTEQARNRRITSLLTWNGQTKPVGAWSDITGVPWHVIYKRLRRGWTVDEALSAPLGARLHPNYVTGPAHHWAKKR